MTNLLVFDIETVPDVDGGRRLYQLEDLPDEDVARVMLTKRRAQTGDSDFLPHYLHRIVAISIALRTASEFKVWSLGEPDSGENELLERFFTGVDKYRPTLVTWNGGGFDLPVIHYRSLFHGVSAERYWDTGESDKSMRYNNYLGRFHWRHIDLMDVLAGFQLRAAAPLDAVAVLLGLPGKLGMSGAAVWDEFQAGRIEEVRNYCETDVLNTYLVFQRFEMIRGNLDEAGWRRECSLVRESLKAEEKPHLDKFLAAWSHGGAGPDATSR